MHVMNIRSKHKCVRYTKKKNNLTGTNDGFLNKFNIKLRSSGILHSEEWQFLTDDSGQHIGPIFKC